jgi:hypothetical protein
MPSRSPQASYVAEIVSAEPPNETFDASLPHVDLERCKKREERALQTAEQEAGRVGEGVTKEAQTLFDALFRVRLGSWIRGLMHCGA